MAVCALCRSGMLPGYVAGYYSYEECHVDLALLTAFAGARLVVATATGIDVQVTHLHSSTNQSCRTFACLAAATIRS